MIPSLRIITLARSFSLKINYLRINSEHVISFSRFHSVVTNTFVQLSPLFCQKFSNINVVKLRYPDKVIITNLCILLLAFEMELIFYYSIVSSWSTLARIMRQLRWNICQSIDMRFA